LELDIEELLYKLFCLYTCVGANFLAVILLSIHGVISVINVPLEPLLFWIHISICFVITVLANLGVERREL